VIGLAQLNGMPAHEFVAQLAGIFEHSPWVALRVAARRPFDSRLQLLDAMRSAVASASPEEQISLIRAHPKLKGGGRGAGLTGESSREQRRAGLEGCAPDDAARLDQLNAAYDRKFSMPLILAVRGHTPQSIIAAGELRLANDPAIERHAALHQIGLIAGYRLADLVSDSQD
jgi:OHCU decarboxylase